MSPVSIIVKLTDNYSLQAWADAYLKRLASKIMVHALPTAVTHIAPCGHSGHLLASP